jgi:hypothetical protein
MKQSFYNISFKEKNTLHLHKMDIFKWKIYVSELDKINYMVNTVLYNQIIYI